MCGTTVVCAKSREIDRDLGQCWGIFCFYILVEGVTF